MSENVDGKGRDEGDEGGKGGREHGGGGKVRYALEAGGLESSGSEALPKN